LFQFGIPSQSSRGLEHSKALRVHVGRESARQRLGVRRPSAAFQPATPATAENFFRPVWDFNGFGTHKPSPEGLGYDRGQNLIYPITPMVATSLHWPVCWFLSR